MWYSGPVLKAFWGLFPALNTTYSANRTYSLASFWGRLHHTLACYACLLTQRRNRVEIQPSADYLPVVVTDQNARSDTCSIGTCHLKLTSIGPNSCGLSLVHLHRCLSFLLVVKGIEMHLGIDILLGGLFILDPAWSVMTFWPIELYFTKLSKVVEEFAMHFTACFYAYLIRL
jgi:hypothetical protein